MLGACVDVQVPTSRSSMESLYRCRDGFALMSCANSDLGPRLGAVTGAPWVAA